MKQKRNFYIALILLLFLILSIGYGVFSTNLNISGTAQMNSSSWDIHFENLNENEKSIEASTPASINDTKTTINFTVDLEKPGDFYEFNVDIVNAGTIDAMISEVLKSGLDSSLEKYITYTVKYSKGIELQEKDSLKAGTSENIVVRVEFNKDVNEEDLPQTQQSISLSFEVEYIQDDGTSNEVIAPVLAATSRNDTSAFRSETYKQNIKTITLEEEINIPDDAIESWDVGEAQNGNVMAYVVPNVEDSTMYDLYIQGDGALIANEDSSNTFYYMKKLETINNIELLNTSNVTNMNSMFYTCSSLQILDLSKWDTSNVIDMSEMFRYSSSLTNLDVSKFDTSNVFNMESMFDGNSSLTTLNVSNFDTSQVEYMAGMFSNTSSIITLDVSNFDTSNVTNMSSMFYGMNSLTSLDLNNFNTSNVNYMSSMFKYANSLTSLDLSSFNTHNLILANDMFYGASSLRNLDLSSFNTSNVTNMSYMFSETDSLTNLDLSNFDISNVTDMRYMFFKTNSNINSIILNKTPFNNSVSTAHIFGSTPTYTIMVNSDADKTLIDSLGYTNVTVTVG